MYIYMYICIRIIYTHFIYIYIHINSIIHELIINQQSFWTRTPLWPEWLREVVSLCRRACSPGCGCLLQGWYRWKPKQMSFFVLGSRGDTVWDTVWDSWHILIYLGIAGYILIWYIWMDDFEGWSSRSIPGAWNWCPVYQLACHWWQQVRTRGGDTCDLLDRGLPRKSK